MSALVIRRRQIYRVSLKGGRPIKMYLSTGDFRSLEKDADCVMTGHTFDTIGLTKERERGRIEVKPFEIVAPDPKKSPDAYERYAATMRHLMRGFVLFLSDMGIVHSPASDRDLQEDRFAAKRQEKVLLPNEEVEKTLPTEEVESDQADRLEGALSRSPLKVLKGGEESDSDTEEEGKKDKKESEEDVDLIIDEPEEKEDSDDKNKSGKSGSGSKSSKKSKKGKKRSKKKSKD